MSYKFRPARRENVPLLIGLAGGTGSGKTWSAMALAKGISGDKPFAVIDTENGRAKHYADEFQFEVADLHAPFRPDAYAEAIQTADQAGYSVIVVDSMSHEWAGDGGMLDWQEDELRRLGGGDNVKMLSWVEPKRAHRKFVTRLLQVRAHVILCFRAAEKIEMIRNAQGKMEVVPKRSLVGLDGWVPIAEKELPYELTLSALLTADAPGVPKPIKLPEKLRPLVPLDAPLTDRVGAALAEWARGGASSGLVADDQPATDAQRKQLVAFAREHGLTDDDLRAVMRDCGVKAPKEFTLGTLRRANELVLEMAERAAAAGVGS